MIERLEQLKKESVGLEAGAPVRESWARAVTAFGEQHMAGLVQARSFQASEEEGKGILQFPITEEPEEASTLVEALSTHVASPGVRLGAPGFMAFIPISTCYPAALGD